MALSLSAGGLENGGIGALLGDVGGVTTTPTGAWGSLEKAGIPAIKTPTSHGRRGEAFGADSGP